MRRWKSIILAALLPCIFLSPMDAQDPASAAQKKPAGENLIRIAVLYINTPTGIEHRQGIEEAVTAHDYHKDGHIKLDPQHYTTANDGFEMLTNMILNKEADIILGPTESDIFVRAVGMEEEFAEQKIPVISGLVTAKVGNRKDGWFFRINVDVSRRIQIIFDFLNKYWISTIAVLYADTEFGRRAERAFMDELELNDREDCCMSLLYDTPPNPRKQLHAIIENRPEAVGLFCERENLEQIYKQLKTMNKSAIPYNPLLFTILDVRRLKNQVDDIYFVSLTADDTTTEVKSLGHDLGILVLRALAAMNRDNTLFSQKFDEEKRLEFRKQLAIIMSLSGEMGNTKTKMGFNKFENTVVPPVFHLEGKNVKLVTVPEYVGWPRKFIHKVKLVFAIYSYWIYIALIVIFILAFSISRMEIKRLFPFKHVKVYRTKFFYLYTVSHFLLVVLIYLFLCETNRIKYDDILLVIIISLTPSAFLRTTFFETRYGKAIGLEGLYKSLMSRIEEKIMYERYSSFEALTNVIAYSNSLDSIRKSLLQVYRNHPSKLQRSKLIQKMEEDIDNEPDYLNKRRVGARLLMKQFNQEQLKAEGFVPPNWDYDHPVDPKLIIREAAKHCAQDETRIETIDKLLTEQMESLRKRSPERYKEVNDFMQKELDVTIAIEGILSVKIRSLFVLVGFDADWLIEKDLVDKEKLIGKGLYKEQHEDEEKSSKKP